MLFRVFLLATLLLLPGLGFADSYTEIHCKHFIYGYPVGVSKGNDLIIRDIYALSSNNKTKFADWVAYRLDKASITSNVKTSRKWKADPWLDEDETLEPDDYKGAHAQLKVDRGHFAPLADFKGTLYWQDTNYLSNISPQKSALNQGPWMILENRIRQYIAEHHAVLFVMTGPVYGDSDEWLPQADEPHRIPVGYWKIVAEQANTLNVAAFFFPQETQRDAEVSAFVASVDKIEQLSGLNFFTALDKATEKQAEYEINFKFVRQLLKN